MDPMKLVMKFGGASVADGEKIRRVGTIVERFHKEGNLIVVVTSAMYSVTNSLIDVAHHAGKGHKDHVRRFIEETTVRHRSAA
jgi:aspartate kinase